MPLTSTPMRAFAWGDGLTLNAQSLRLQQGSALLTGASPSGSTGVAARPGVRPGTGDPLKIAASSGMTLSVNAGIAAVQGSASATAGMYTCCLDTASTVTLAASDATNPRIDNIIVQVTDNGDGTSTAIVTPQTGTPAGSPVAPTPPSNSLLLAQVSVAALTSTIVAGNITDKRPWTAAVGGIVPMKDVTSGITGMAGLYADDLSTGRLKRSDGSGNARAPKVAAFAPVTAQVDPANVTSSASWVNLASVTFTADGVTEVEISATWRSVDNLAGTPASTDGLSVAFSTVSGSASWLGVYNNDFYVFIKGGTQAGYGNIRSWLTPPSGANTIYIVGQLDQAATYALRDLNLRAQANVHA